MIYRLLTYIGSKYGDQDEVWVCQRCKWEWPIGDWSIFPEENDAEASERGTELCPCCGSELAIRLPNEEMLPLRYQAWKHTRRWIPQREYVFSMDGESYRHVRLAGRSWFRRPCEPLFPPGAEATAGGRDHGEERF